MISQNYKNHIESLDRLTLVGYKHKAEAWLAANSESSRYEEALERYEYICDTLAKIYETIIDELNLIATDASDLEWMDSNV